MNIKVESSFFNMLGNLLNKGYSLKDSLQLMDYTHSSLSSQISCDILGGQSFAESISNQRFSMVAKEIIKIGEKSNKLATAIQNINDYFILKLKFMELINKILIYPLIVFCSAFICFLFIETKVLPMINTFTNNNGGTSSNLIINFLAFNGLKTILFIMLVLFIFHKLQPQVFNVIQLLKLYRSIYLSTNILLLVESGASLEESLLILKDSLNEKVYNIELLISFIITGTFSDRRFSPYHQNFKQFLVTGIKTNNMVSMLSDFKICYTEILFQKLTRLVHSIQFIIFVVLSTNIFLIYYIIMVPMMELSRSI